MLRIALAGLRGHAVRLLLTGLAVVVGVSFLAGTLVYGDTATAAFYADLARSARGVDVDVRAFDEKLKIAPEALATVRAVPGVATADGRYQEHLPLLGPDGRIITDAGRVGIVLSLPGALRPYDVAAGRLPQAPGEVAIDRSTVDVYGFALGGTVRGLDRTGVPHPLTLVGVLDLGVNRQYFGLTVSTVDDSTLRALTRSEGYAEIAIAAAPGTDPVALQRRVRDALHAQYRVRTGDQLRQVLARRAAKYVDGFLAVLVAFGLVALTVSAFVIYNTFAILAAQRSRELALLRCLGAGRRQLVAAVLVEAALVGLLASIVGLAGSVLVGYGLIGARDLIGAQIPAHPPVVGVTTAVVALGLGTAITVFSALVPAVAAGRVAPLTALGAADAAPARPARRAPRLAVGGTLAAAGLAAALRGVPDGFAGLPLVFAGAMLGFLAVVTVAPLGIGRVVAVLGWLPGRWFGAPARLATENARRNPRRTAAVATALMIGVALMSMLSVLLATARTQTGRELTENFPVDFVLTRAAFGTRDGLPDGMTATLRDRSEFATVVGVRTESASIAGRRVTAWAVEPGGLAGRISPEVTEGTLAGFGPGRVALARQLAWDERIAVGDRVEVPGAGALTVVAFYDDSPVDASALLSWPDFGSAFGPGQADQVLVNAAPGLSTVDARRALDDALRPYPVVEVGTLGESRAALDGTLDQLLGIFAALLGLSVAIAIFGIGNTLTLSVVERVRETAILRALGLSRRQVRGMLLVEAGLMATAGALGGVLFGLAVGWTAAAALIRTYGHGLPTVPAGQLAGFTALAVVAALVAGVLPARRAARPPDWTAGSG